MQKSALIIFIKNPIPGKTKTRLAATVGDEKAIQIYKAMLQHTREICLELDVDRYLFYSQSVDLNDEWGNRDFTKKKQDGPDLGARMRGAFKQVLSNHDRAIIIGSDCPRISTKIIKAAFRRLNRADFVAGPAQDGGYYLLGMNDYESSLFFNIEWSSSKVLSETLERIWDAGKTYSLLPTLSDVDTEEDWKKYGWKLEESS